MMEAAWARSRRVLVGGAIAAVGLGSVAFRPLFAVLIFSIAYGSLYEFAKLSERKGSPFAYPVASAAVTLYLGLTYVGTIHRYESVLLAATVIGALLYATFTERGNYLSRSAYTLLGVLYIGKLLSYSIEIRSIPELGMGLTIYAILLIGITDVAAMVVGVRFGRTPLTRLSPNKTVEGALAGLAGALGFGVLIGTTAQLAFTWWQGLLIAAITSCAAQAGDIVESALKRDARVKDAGAAFIGHGGVLDRFDSFIFGGIAFYFAVWLVGFDMPHLHDLMRSAQR